MQVSPLPLPAALCRCCHIQAALALLPLFCQGLLLTQHTFHPSQNRHRAALVCRQWHDCVHTPQLCGDVTAGGYECADALDSLTSWLQRHGPLVHSLRLEAYGEYGGTHPDEGLMLGCCLSTCAAFGRLERLCIQANGARVAAAWVQPRRSLRDLTLVAGASTLAVSASLEHHTQLTALRLEGQPVAFGRGVQLPPSLLCMRLLDSHHTKSLPNQARTISI